MYGSTPAIAHERIDGCVGAVCPVGLEVQGSVQACQQFPEYVWIEPAYRCADVDGWKTTIVFSTFAVCSNIQYAVTDEVDCKHLKNSKTIATDESDMRYRSDFKNG